MSLENLDEIQISSLTTALEQLKRKKEILSQLDTRIAESITVPGELALKEKNSKTHYWRRYAMLRSF